MTRSVPLSQLLLSIRMSRALLWRISLRRDGRLHVARSGLVVCHLVLTGTPGLDHVGRRTIALDAGDFCCFRFGSEHVLLGSERATARTCLNLREDEGDEPVFLGVGEGPPAAEVLTCIFGLGADEKSRLQSRFPEFELLRHGDLPAALAGVTLETDSLLRGPGASAVATGIMKLLFDQLIRRSMPVETGRIRGISELNFSRISSALRLMDGNLAHAWTVSELAGDVGMSRSAFFGAFQDMAGTTPAAWLADRRCDEAARLLARESMSVGRVAAAVGYSSPSAFSRAFAARIGMGPRQYRRSTSPPRQG